MGVQLLELHKSSAVKRMAVSVPLIALILTVMKYPVPWLFIFTLVVLVAAYYEVANMALSPVPAWARSLLRLPKPEHGSDLAWLLGGVMLVGMACLVGWTLADSSLAVTLLAGVTLTDGFAWAVGSIYGRVAKARGWEIWKFAPDISPKKTWPGTLGGILGGMLAAQPVAALVGFGVPLTPSLYSKLLVVCVAGVLGDLLQSYVKRKAGLKDAGGLLPGHGGVTERLDSVVFAFLTLTLLQFA